MKIKRKPAAVLVLFTALSTGALVDAWRAQGQNRPTQQQTPQRWEYEYDAASKSFPSEADKARISLYGINGWELVAVVPGQSNTALVFKRMRQPGK